MTNIHTIHIKKTTKEKEIKEIFQKFFVLVTFYTATVWPSGCVQIGMYVTSQKWLFWNVMIRVESDFSSEKFPTLLRPAWILLLLLCNIICVWFLHFKIFNNLLNLGNFAFQDIFSFILALKFYVHVLRVPKFNL